MSPPPPVTRLLAEWVVSVRPADLPGEVQERLRDRLIDTLGLIVVAHDLPAARAVRRVALEQGGAAQTRLIVTGEAVPAATAALVHGSLAHSLDFDDTLPGPVVHPGSLVLPTALAVAHARGRPAEDLSVAIAVGYELAARLGAAAGRALHARGFHATGVLGPVVAAGVAARLTGMGVRETAEAMGLSTSMGGGLLEFLSDGSWSKRLHPGWAAQAGVIAARLVAEGFKGPSSGLEGRHGLYAAFLAGGEAADFGATLANLGVTWVSQTAEFKFYPCAHIIHPVLDAALEVRRTGQLEPERIRRVDVFVPPWAVPIVCEPRAEKNEPATEYQARTSLPFALAAALLDGRVDLETFTDASIRRVDLRTFADRIRIHADAALDEGFSGSLSVETDDGVLAVTPEDPRTIEERVTAKFRALTASVLGERQVAALLDLTTDPMGFDAGAILGATIRS